MRIHEPADQWRLHFAGGLIYRARKFSDVALDGLNVALAVHAPGNMVRTKWKAAVYIDDQASAPQKNALLTIFSGQAGGHPAVFVSFVGQLMGAKSVPRVRYRSDGKKSSLSIPGVAESRNRSA